MIKIGTSGFSFDDWQETIYPPHLKKTEWLTFYEKELGFTVLEVNFTYYRLPSQKSFTGMSRKTTDSFEFAVKAHRDMTHNLRDTATGKMLDTGEVFKKFAFSLKPLVQDGKLACILMQFPYSFHLARENVDYLKKAKDLIGDLQVIVEFRNRSWLRGETFTFLKENNLGYCAVDEPKLQGLMPFVPNTTSDIGYLRFHGRNKKWFNAPLSVRYDYRYTAEELSTFIEPVKKMQSRTQNMLVFFNNCHAGQAAQNALMFAKMLAENKIDKT